MPSTGAVNLPALDWRAFAVLAVAGAALLWYLDARAQQIGHAVAGTAADAVDVVTGGADRPNIAARTADGLWQGLTGSADAIGADIYDFIHTGSIYGKP